MWKIEHTDESIKNLRRIPKGSVKRILADLEAVAALESPFTHRQVKRLTGDLKSLSRLRVGEYRVIFKLQTDKKQIMVVSILPRGSAYR